ncbi:MAG TPA: FHA domain-containing protein [Polyangiaceae bacterium]|nr:FHA domain-containing protein [Polyangiaceae bacterium]
MITCPSCEKQNQDHYRFCLGCGAELPRGGVSTARVDTGPPPPVIQDEETFSGTGSSPPAALEATEMGMGLGAPPGTCPECGHINPPTNRFCASCGFRLGSPSAAPKKVSRPAPASSSEVAAVLVCLDPEGNEIGRHDLKSGETVIGRSTGGIFSSDVFLSPDHAVFHAKSGKITIEDAGSLNGLFRKLLAEQSERLQPGQRFRIGQELLQYDELDPGDPDDNGVIHMGTEIEGTVGKISLVVGRDTARPSTPIPERGLNLGRERGDVLFPDDGYVSGLHCHLSYEDGEVFVTDLGSSNGTFVQLMGPVELKNGDVLLMGQQLFRVTI